MHMPMILLKYILFSTPQSSLVLHKAGLTKVHLLIAVVSHGMIKLEEK